MFNRGRRYAAGSMAGAALIAGLLASAAVMNATTRVAQAAPPAREFPTEWFWDDDEAVATAHKALEGQPMPALEVSEWINGEVKPADLKGKVVVVDFWATWCGPCLASIPHNNEMLKTYKDQGLVIVGVCTSRNGQEKMAQTVESKKIEYPTAKDPDLKAQAAWAVHYYPTYAVVDRAGKVRAVGLQPGHVEAVVKKLLAEQAG